MLHDRYNLDIEQVMRTMPYLGRDNDEAGQEGFWDLAGTVAGEINTYSDAEKQELLYNAFHKIREEAIKYTLRYASTLPNYSHEEMEPIRDVIALVTDAENIKL